MFNTHDLIIWEIFVTVMYDLSKLPWGELPQVIMLGLAQVKSQLCSLWEVWNVLTQRPWCNNLEEEQKAPWLPAPPCCHPDQVPLGKLNPERHTGTLRAMGTNVISWDSLNLRWAFLPTPMIKKSLIFWLFLCCFQNDTDYMWVQADCLSFHMVTYAEQDVVAKLPNCLTE